MFTDRAVQVMRTGVRYYSERQARELVDSDSCIIASAPHAELRIANRGNERWGESVNIPNLGSATTREAFFSSLTELSKFESIGETLFSTIAVTSSSAVAALSNFANCFNFSLHTTIRHQHAFLFYSQPCQSNSSSSVRK